jgi:hypothetical protein
MKNEENKQFLAFLSVMNGKMSQMLESDEKGSKSDKHAMRDKKYMKKTISVFFPRKYGKMRQKVENDRNMSNNEERRQSIEKSRKKPISGFCFSNVRKYVKKAGK